MPHQTKHNIEIEVKTYLEKYAEREILNKIDFKKLRDHLARSIGLRSFSTRKNGNLFTNKITLKQKEYIEGSLDTIIYFEDLIYNNKKDSNE